MKKIFIVAFIYSLSQLMYGQTTRWGGKAGANLSSFKGDNDHLMAIAGFHAGILMDYNLSETLSVQSELLYTSAGAKTSAHWEEGKYKETLRLGYISVPVMLKYYPVKSLSLGAGAEVGWLVSSRVKYDRGSVPPTATCNKCIMAQMEKLACGINAGLTYWLSAQLFIEARYHLGLTDVYKNNNAVSGTFRNAVFQLSLGYKL